MSVTGPDSVATTLSKRESGGVAVDELICPDCDAEKLDRVRESNTPLPPEDNPAAGMR